MIWIIGLGIVGLIGGIMMRRRDRANPLVLALPLVGVLMGLLIAMTVALRAPEEICLVERIENITYDRPYVFYLQKMEDEYQGNILKTIRLPRERKEVRFYEHDRPNSVLEIWEEQAMISRLWGPPKYFSVKDRVYKIYVPRNNSKKLQK